MGRDFTLIRDVPQVVLSDMVEHFCFVNNHQQHIKKVALVSDAEIADILPSLVSHFVRVEIKSFAYDECEKAVAWII